GELEVLDHEERGREDRGGHEERCRVRGGERAAGEQPQRHHRGTGPSLPGQERGDQDQAGGDEDDRLGAGPAEGAGPGQAPDQRGGPAADQGDAGQVDAGRRSAAVGELEAGQDGGGDPDGNVDPEDPVPVQALGDGTADQRAASDAQAGDAAPDADDG